jgi:hypothetical protein
MVRTSTSPAFEAGVEYSAPWIVGIGGGSSAASWGPPSGSSAWRRSGPNRWRTR